MECYERLNQAFASWQEDSPSSLEQRVETLETNVSTLTNDVNDLETELGTKQDIISDLSTIRSGAAAGSTAVQPADMSAALTLKQDKLTFDSAPTESSTNPVTSGGVWTDQQRQDALEAEDRAALVQQVDGGAKNFLDTSISTLKNYNTASSAIWDGSSYTQNGITYVVNSDGTISVSGTATSTSFMVLADRTYLNKKITRGRYSISGCPTGGGSSGATYRIFCLNPNANISSGYTDTGNGYTGEFYYDDSKDCNISIGVGKGCVITDPIVFKPMLCTDTDYTISPAFVPYRPSWQEMWDMIQALQNGS